MQYYYLILKCLFYYLLLGCRFGKSMFSSYLESALFWKSVFASTIKGPFGCTCSLYCMILLTVSYAIVQTLSWEFRTDMCSKVRSLVDTV